MKRWLRYGWACAYASTAIDLTQATIDGRPLAFFSLNYQPHGVLMVPSILLALAAACILGPLFLVRAVRWMLGRVA